MAAIKKVLPHQVLFNSLLSWAQEHGLTSDPYIAGLSSAVENRKNLPMWASLNPLEYLPHAPARFNRALKQSVLVMTITRNTLVFAPVALTWFAISKATSAFVLYRDENTTGVVTFLDFWENGYGFLGQEWALSRIAILDFLIIIVIIALTITVALLDKRIRDAHSASIHELDEDRIRLAMSIASFLFDHQRVSQVTMNQSLAKALRDILNSTDSLEKTSKERNKTVKAIPSNREILNQIKTIKSRSIFDRS